MNAPKTFRIIISFSALQPSVKSSETLNFIEKTQTTYISWSKNKLVINENFLWIELKNIFNINTETASIVSITILVSIHNLPCFRSKLILKLVTSDVIVVIHARKIQLQTEENLMTEIEWKDSEHNTRKQFQKNTCTICTFAVAHTWEDLLNTHIICSCFDRIIAASFH